jgi:hypothetical protein
MVNSPAMPDERVSERFRCAGLNVSIVSDISTVQVRGGCAQASLWAIARLHQVLKFPIYRESLDPSDRITASNTFSARWGEVII